MWDRAFNPIPPHQPNVGATYQVARALHFDGRRPTGSPLHGFRSGGRSSVNKTLGALGVSSRSAVGVYATLCGEESAYSNL